MTRYARFSRLNESPLPLICQLKTGCASVIVYKALNNFFAVMDLAVLLKLLDYAQVSY